MLGYWIAFVKSGGSDKSKEWMLTFVTPYQGFDRSLSLLNIAIISVAVAFVLSPVTNGSSCSSPGGTPQMMYSIEFPVVGRIALPGRGALSGFAISFLRDLLDVPRI